MSKKSQMKAVEIKSKSLDQLSEDVQSAYKGYTSTSPNWSGNYKGQAPGVRAGKRYMNRSELLPTIDGSGNRITYREFDINPKVGTSRDAERFVVGSDESVYFIDDHYDSFIKIKERN